MSVRQGYGFIQTLSGTVFTASIVSATSYLDVSEYNKITLQPTYLISGSSTGSVTVQSSLDNTNWFTDFTFTAMSNSSSINYISNRRNYIRALNTITNNATGSLFILAGA